MEDGNFLFLILQDTTIGPLFIYHFETSFVIGDSSSARASTIGKSDRANQEEAHQNFSLTLFTLLDFTTHSICYALDHISFLLRS